MDSFRLLGFFLLFGFGSFRRLGGFFSFFGLGRFFAFGFGYDSLGLFSLAFRVPLGMTVFFASGFPALFFFRFRSRAPAQSPA